MKRNKGFTLVELIIVIAILAILTASVSLSLTKYIAKSRAAVDLQACTQVQKAVELALTKEEAFNDFQLIFSNHSRMRAYIDGSGDTTVESVFSSYVYGQFNIELISILGEYFPVSKTGKHFLVLVKAPKEGNYTVSVELIDNLPDDVKKVIYDDL